MHVVVLLVAVLFATFTKATVVSLLPLWGWLLCLLHVALLYSLYSFEYKWFYEGEHNHIMTLFASQ